MKNLEELLAYAVPEGDCLIWPYCVAQNGYGQVRWEGKTWLVHRLSFYLANGHITPKAPIHHKCARRTCINPNHLQMASQADNMLEMLARKDFELRIKQLEDRVTALESRLSLYEEV